jgi:hypothetical protein
LKRCDCQPHFVVQQADKAAAPAPKVPAAPEVEATTEQLLTVGGQLGSQPAPARPGSAAAAAGVEGAPAAEELPRPGYTPCVLGDKAIGGIVEVLALQMFNLRSGPAVSGARGTCKPCKHICKE